MPDFAGPLQRLGTLFVGAELAEDADRRGDLTPSALEIAARDETLGEHAKRFSLDEAATLGARRLEGARERLFRSTNVSKRQPSCTDDAKSIRLANRVGYTRELIGGAGGSNLCQCRITRLKRQLGALEPR